MTSSDLRLVACRAVSVLGGLLQRPDLGVEDNFFSFGGDSMLAMHAAVALREEFGLPLPMHVLFEAPTAAELARQVLDLLPGVGGDVNLTRGGDQESAARGHKASHAGQFLSYQQEQLWLSELIEPGSRLAYLLEFDLELVGDVDVQRLRSAWEGLFARHPVLASAFISSGDGLPRLSVVPGPHTLEVVSARVEGSDLEAALRVHRDAVRQEVGGMSGGPLIRARGVTLEDGALHLVVCAHHAVMDATSVGVLVNDLVALYEDSAAALPAGEADYFTYASHQRAFWRQGGDRLDAAVSSLSPLGPALRFNDYPGPRQERSYHGEYVDRPLPENVWSRLTETAASHGLTRYTFLLGAAAWVLRQYSGQDEVVIGVPVANRQEFGGSWNQIGFYANVVPVRIRMGPADTAESYLAHVKDACTQGYARGDIPLVLLANRLRAYRDARTNPIYQVIVGHHDRLAPRVTPSGTWRVRRLDQAKALMDLQVEFEEYEGGCTAVWQFDPSVIDQELVRRMADDLEVCLQVLLTDADEDLTHRAMTRRPSIVSGRASTAASGTPSLMDRVLAHAAATPDAIAVVNADGTSQSWSELVGSAGALAAQLGRAGVAPGATVGVLVGRSAPLCTIILAIWWTGGVYIPFPTEGPVYRLERMRDTARPGVLVCDEDEAAKVVGWNLPIVAVGTATPDDPPPVAQQRGAAYVMFTSGSTGRPRAVSVGHEALSSRLAAFSEQLDVSTDDALVACTPWTFDISLLELALPLYVGGGVVITDTLPAAVSQIRKAIDAGNITVLQATPAGWTAVLDDGWEPARPLRAWVGGEAVPLALVHQLAACSSEVVNLYGPTEATIWCTFAPLGLQDSRVHVGRPFCDTTVIVLDSHGRPSPVGVTGEVALAGKGLADGYLDPGETDGFRVMPRAVTGAGRAYMTGDLGRLREDGCLEVSGRRDDQVKIRGFRVELGEIESLLLAHPAVASAAVVRTAISIVDARIDAFFTLAPGHEVSTDALVRWLATRLPTHMLPATCQEVQSIPLTTHGKVDRARLQTLGPTRPGSHDRTPTGELAGVWQDVVRWLPSHHGNFFREGGTSLLATQLISAVNRRFLASVTVRDFFKDPTYAGLTKMLAAGSTSGPQPGQARRARPEGFGS
jgi:amino acid adenylation domain-containing protein